MLIAFLRVLLAIVAAAAVVGLGFVLLRMPEGGGSQGEWLYAAAFLVLVLILVFGQYSKLQERVRRAGRRGPFTGFDVSFGSAEPQDLDNASQAQRGSFRISFGSEEPRSFETSFGDGPRQSFDISFGSAEPQVFRVDRAQIDRARDQLQRGRDLEEVIAEVVPEYARLNMIEKRLYRSAFEAALKAEP